MKSTREVGMDTTLMAVARAYAEEIKDSLFIPSAIRGDLASVTHIILTALEMGLPASHATRAIWVAQTKDGPRMAMSADAMLALLYKNGVKIRFEEMNRNRVVISAKRGDMEYTSSFSMEDARLAGLLSDYSGKPRENWQKYPVRMLRARAVAALFRDIGPDFGGIAIWTPEELEDIETPPPTPEGDKPKYKVGKKHTPDAPPVERPEQTEDQQVTTETESEVKAETQATTETPTEESGSDENDAWAGGEIPERVLSSINKKAKERIIATLEERGLSDKKASEWYKAYLRGFFGKSFPSDMQAYVKPHDIALAFFDQERGVVDPANLAEKYIAGGDNRAEVLCQNFGIPPKYSTHVRIARFRLGLTYKDMYEWFESIGIDRISNRGRALEEVMRIMVASPLESVREVKKKIDLFLEL